MTTHAEITKEIITLVRQATAAEQLRWSGCLEFTAVGAGSQFILRPKTLQIASIATNGFPTGTFVGPEVEEFHVFVKETVSREDRGNKVRLHALLKERFGL